MTLGVCARGFTNFNNLELFAEMSDLNLIILEEENDI